MFDDLTLQAKYVLRYARQQAQSRLHECMDTEHVLLAMMWDSTGVAADVLRKLGVDFNQVYCAVSRRAPSGVRFVSLEGMAMTKAVHNSIVFARSEARRLGQEPVGTGHLLLGLLHDSETAAAQILGEIGPSTAELRDAALAALATVNEASLLPVDRRPQEKRWACLTQELFKRLEGIADKRAMKLNELLCRILEEWLDQQEHA